MSVFKQRFAQKQIQTLSLSYNMKLSLDLLQLNSLQLQQFLEKELLENPMFEVDMPIQFSSNSYDEFDIMDTKKSLQDDLFMQIKDKKVNLAIIEGILRQCDHNGYLCISKEELADHLQISMVDLTICLTCIHNCIPYGIAAESVSECLAIQLEHRYPEADLTRQLVEHHLEDIAKHYFDKLAKQYHVEQAEIKRCVEQIQTLDPRPASSYDMENMVFVKPDILLEVVDECVSIIMPNYFNIKEQEYYKGYNLDKADASYIKEKRAQGKAIISCLENRKETLYRIMQVMIEKQALYLLHKGHLKYLIMKDIAETIGVHETTISRAMKDKYYEFEGQVYPLYKLLCKQLHDMSIDDVIKALKELIKLEDPLQPLSDQSIVTMLNEKGIACSRRTIAKYRMEHQIPNAKTRKRRKENRLG